MALELNVYLVMCGITVTFLILSSVLRNLSGAFMSLAAIFSGFLVTYLSYSGDVTGLQFVSLGYYWLFIAIIGIATLIFNIKDYLTVELASIDEGVEEVI